MRPIQGARAWAIVVARVQGFIGARCRGLGKELGGQLQELGGGGLTQRGLLTSPVILADRGKHPVCVICRMENNFLIKYSSSLYLLKVN